MKFAALLASLAALASFAVFAHTLSTGGTAQPQPYTPGQPATLVAEPWPTVWPSLLLNAEVRLPSGAEYPPPHTITLTPTATPEPTATPVPTAVPATVPPPSESQPETPQSVSGGIEGLICSFGWDCATALRIARCESGLNPGAYNGHHVGLFQMDPNFHTWRSATGELWSAYGNVSAAWHLYLEQGWGPWSCA